MSSQHKVEYAKTGRSSCQKCYTTIDAGNVRIGTLTKSTKFDGEYFTWKHLDCFFSGGSVDINSINGITLLKFDDQKKIQEAASSGAADSWSVEYAKSGRSSCRGCGKTIENKSMRFGKAVQDEYEYYSSTHYYHPECADIPSGLDKSAISGSNKLKPEDKKQLEALLKPKPTKRKGKEGKEDLKKQKVDEEKLRKESEKLWKKKEEIAKKFTKDEQKAILSLCDQSVHGGPDEILMRVADIATSGKLPHCEICEGHLIRVGEQIHCTGNISEWTKCTFKAANDDIKRKKFTLPSQKKIDDELENLQDVKDSLKEERQKAVSDALDPKKKKKKAKNAAPRVVALDENAGVSEDVAEVLTDRDGDAYAIVLNQADMNVGTRGRNSYYRMQLLKFKKGKKFLLYNRWGRVGVSEIENSTSTNFTDEKTAISKFAENFYDKTHNGWMDYLNGNFKKQPNKFFVVENAIEEDDDEEEEEEAPKPKAKGKKGKAAKAEKEDDEEDVAPKLDSRLRSVLKILFDEDTIVGFMKEKLSLDTKKLPLGKISKTQIDKGYKILESLEKELAKKKPVTEILTDLSNQFYTTIPHDFGSSKPPTISTEDTVKKKYELLGTLTDLSISASIMKKKRGDKDPMLTQYMQLGNKLVPLDQKGDEYQRISTYLENTKESAPITLLDAFSVDRDDEAERFQEHKDLKERKLLWHGSSVAVFGAILKTGLRIMPHSGGRVGSGLYFADMVNKSQGYCTPDNKGVGFILLNEVALGKSNLIQRDNSSLKAAPKGFQSVLAQGTQHPDPNSDFVDTKLSVSKHPVVWPLGKKKNSGVSSSFLHNEYLVYQESQVQMKYLLKIQWNWNKNW